jgi:hypothetical protein
VADNAHYRREDREIFRVRLRCRHSLHEKKCKPDRREPLKRVDKKNRIAPSLSQDPEDVGGSDVAAAESPDVNARDAPGDVTSGERAEKITERAKG